MEDFRGQWRDFFPAVLVSLGALVAILYSFKVKHESTNSSGKFVRNLSGKIMTRDSSQNKTNHHFVWFVPISNPYSSYHRPMNITLLKQPFSCRAETPHFNFLVSTKRSSEEDHLGKVPSLNVISRTSISPASCCSTSDRKFVKVCVLSSSSR